MTENKDRGKIPAQIVDIARLKIDELSSILFGSITFSVRYGNIYRMQIVSDTLMDKTVLPKDVLNQKTKEELIEIILRSSKQTDNKENNSARTGS